jgi:ribosomal-protein-alanine N-acetyltransferase
MTIQPMIETERLLLRPFNLDDAPRVKELAGEWEIAETTATIPHTYENGVAEEWIETHAETFEKDQGVTFAIVLKKNGILIGAIDILVRMIHEWAELAYWIGKPYWNQGYCTEAAKEVLRYGFDQLGVNRIYARHMTKNPASGRVLQKIGMTREGILRQALKRFGKFEDAVLYSILQDDFYAH